MTAKIIDGKALSAKLKENATELIAKMKAKGIQAKLTVILVGDDPASQVYVGNKAKTFKNMGLDSEVIQYTSSLTQEELIKKINQLNEDNTVNGILVQLPLPSHIDSQAIIAAIDPAKDVDGFHIENAGALMTGQPNIIPCTPYGIMKMLKEYQVNLWGAEAVVIGASNIVGKPIALLLQKEGATVTICNSKTKDLKAFTQRADVVIVAVGRPAMLTGDMIKKGATIIDVGINRLDNGKLKGDVDFDSCLNKAYAITPVPGGVGPMTIVMLLINTLEATLKQHKITDLSL